MAMSKIKTLFVTLVLTITVYVVMTQIRQMMMFHMMPRSHWRTNSPPIQIIFASIPSGTTDHKWPSSGALFRTKPLVIWGSDYHISPIRDLKHLLMPMGVKFIDKSLSGHCHLTNTCARDLKVINRGNAMDLHPSLIAKFYEAYKNDPLMQSVDAFICFHSSAMCELFMPFNKSLIVIASTRYELGRFSPPRWKQWNQNLIKISKDPKNVVGGNNLYDAEYIKYFTGIQTEVFPSYCGYIPASYKPTRPGYLLAPVHVGGMTELFMKEYNAAMVKLGSNITVRPLRQLYPHYKYSDLTAHQGMVYIPYQVSVMSLFEQYRMNIPLFFPSLKLLTEWQVKHHVLHERTWAMVGGRTPSKSPIPGVDPRIPDPNNEVDGSAIKYWIKYADFYQWPHVTYYDSAEDLIRKFQSINCNDISEKMKKYNEKVKADLTEKWRKVLIKVAEASKNKPR